MKRSDYLDIFKLKGTTFYFFKLEKLNALGFKIDRLPFSIKILVENILRKLDGKIVKEDALKNIAGWKRKVREPVNIPYLPARVLMQDFTGVPAIVDFAAMRDAIKKKGIDPALINPDRLLWKKGCPGQECNERVPTKRREICSAEMGAKKFFQF